MHAELRVARGAHEVKALLESPLEYRPGGLRRVESWALALLIAGAIACHQANWPIATLLGVGLWLIRRLFGGRVAHKRGAVLQLLVANLDYSDYKSSCGNRCTASARDDVEGTMVVADVALGIAVVGAAVGTIIYFVSRPSADHRATR